MVNIIALWNTLYIEAAVQQLVREGFPVSPEDIARLSPLIFDHINLLGRYAFLVPEAVQRGNSARYEILPSLLMMWHEP